MKNDDVCFVVSIRHTHVRCYSVNSCLSQPASITSDFYLVIFNIFLLLSESLFFFLCKIRDESTYFTSHNSLSLFEENGRTPLRICLTASRTSQIYSLVAISLTHTNIFTELAAPTVFHDADKDEDADDGDYYD